LTMLLLSTEVLSNAYCAKARSDTNDNVYCTAIIRIKEIKDFWGIMLIPVCSCIKKIKAVSYYYSVLFS